MTRMLRLPVLAVLLVVLASGVALQAAASPPNHANRFEATFDESTASVTNRIADLGVFQLINTGTGTVEGFGAATLMLSVTQDRTVQPCGPGSWTNSGIRRIVLADGVLVLRNLAYVCQTAAGPQVTGTWTVDGDSSTGVFAGAWGSGDEAVDIPNQRATLSGHLKLAGSEG